MPSPIVWKKPKRECTAKVSGLVIPKAMVTEPGRDVDVSAYPFCGKEHASLTVSATERSTIEQLCRQAEIVLSIQHVERRACQECQEAFIHELSRDEKRWLYASDPKLGPIIGMNIAEGAEGII